MNDEHNNPCFDENNSQEPMTSSDKTENISYKSEIISHTVPKIETDDFSVSPEENNKDITGNASFPENDNTVATPPAHDESYQNSTSAPPPPNQVPPYNERPAINMQFTPKKTPTWLIVLLCITSALFIIVAGLLALNLAKDFIKELYHDKNSHEITSDTTYDKDDTSIEEHLHISDSKKSIGARTTDGALTVKQISEKVRPSVVGVTGENPSDFASASVGSGIIMSADGYIITNNHVIEGMRKIQVVLDDGTTYDARLIGADSKSDLAVIKIDATDLPAAEFGDSEQLEQGDPAIAIGNPAGLQLQNTVTYGIISAINRDIIVEDRAMNLIQTDASINPGNSGGPLVNEFGQVIGINTIKVGISYYEGLGFAIPMNTAKPIIDELISRGYIKGRPSIGITGTTLSERDSAYYGLPSGLYIEYVHPYSDAFKKGIRRGDIITHMNGTKLSSTSEIKQIRDTFTAGDTVTLTIYRNSKEVDIDVILMDEATLSNTQGYSN